MVSATAKCPQCQTPRREAGHQFCTHCGLALKQPCPRCSAELETPAAPFINCSACGHDFWSCQSCGKLYHLDRTACHNSYCPQQDTFWTTRFGADTFQARTAELVLPGTKAQYETPRPGWVGGATAASDLRWSSLHSNGLILSVQESGVVELWAERGAPTPNHGHDFGETSVCLTRLDLGEDSPSGPFFWNHGIYIPGRTSLSVLDMSSSPSLGHRIELGGVGVPLHFAPLGSDLLVWGTSGLGQLSAEGHLKLRAEIPCPKRDGLLLSDGDGHAVMVSGSPPKAHLVGPESVKEIEGLNWSSEVEYALFADHFLLFSGKQMAYLEGENVHNVELPDLVTAQPIYSTEEHRLTLLLSDGSIRTCSTVGDRFSFHCDLAGTPTTWPLKLGDHVFYGTEGRYLCCDEEAIRPRLGSSPMGALTFANGRLFGIQRDGSLYCFEI